MESPILGIIAIAFIAVFFFWLFTGRKPFGKREERKKKSADYIIFLVQFLLIIFGFFAMEDPFDYFNKSIQSIAFYVTIIILVIFFIGLMGVLGDYIVQPRVTKVFDKLKYSPFGESWKEYNAPSVWELYEWNKVLVKYEKKELFKLSIFSKYAGRTLGVRYLISVSFALIFLILVRIFFFSQSNLDTLFLYEVNASSLTILSIEISVLVLFYLYVALFIFMVFDLLSDILKSFHKYYMITPIVYYYGRALQAKNEGRVQQAIKYYKIVLTRAEYGFNYPIKKENGEITMTTVGKENIQKEIDYLKSSSS